MEVGNGLLDDIQFDLLFGLVVWGYVLKVPKFDNLIIDIRQLCLLIRLVPVDWHLVRGQLLLIHEWTKLEVYFVLDFAASTRVALVIFLKSLINDFGIIGRELRLIVDEERPIGHLQVGNERHHIRLLYHVVLQDPILLAIIG